jgi:hypothetical protein
LGALALKAEFGHKVLDGSIEGFHAYPYPGSFRMDPPFFFNEGADSFTDMASRAKLGVKNYVSLRGRNRRILLFHFLQPPLQNDLSE